MYLAMFMTAENWPLRKRHGALFWRACMAPCTNLVNLTGIGPWVLYVVCCMHEAAPTTAREPTPVAHKSVSEHCFVMASIHCARNLFALLRRFVAQQQARLFS
jgi:hypothetical protein